MEQTAAAPTIMVMEQLTAVDPDKQHVKHWHLLNEEELLFLNKFAQWWTTKSTNVSAALQRQAFKTWACFVSENKLDEIKMEAIHVLENSKRGSRNEEELMILQKMCIGLGFVEDSVPSAAVLKLCQDLEFSELPHDSVLFLQGDRASNGKYYMLLDGTVEFLARDGLGAAEYLRKQCSRQQRKHMDSETLRQMLGQSVFTRLSGPFGEIALITTEPRTASAIVTGWARLVTCSREVYRECLLQHQEEKMELVQGLRFLKGLRMLQTWGNDQILRLLYDLKLRRYRPGEQLYAEDTRWRKVYIIRSGQAILTKKLEPTILGGVRTATISTLNRGAVAGDLNFLLYKSQRDLWYQYSCKAGPQGELEAYELSAAKFCMRFTHTVFVRESVEERTKHYSKKAKQAASSGKTTSTKSLSAQLQGLNSSADGEDERLETAGRTARQGREGRQAPLVGPPSLLLGGGHGPGARAQSGAGGRPGSSRAVEAEDLARRLGAMAAARARAGGLGAGRQRRSLQLQPLGPRAGLGVSRSVGELLGLGGGGPPAAYRNVSADSGLPRQGGLGLGRPRRSWAGLAAKEREQVFALLPTIPASPWNGGSAPAADKQKPGVRDERKQLPALQDGGKRFSFNWLEGEAAQVWQHGPTNHLGKKHDQQNAQAEKHPPILLSNSSLASLTAQQMYSSRKESIASQSGLQNRYAGHQVSFNSRKGSLASQSSQHAVQNKGKEGYDSAEGQIANLARLVRQASEPRGVSALITAAQERAPPS